MSAKRDIAEVYPIIDYSFDDKSYQDESFTRYLLEKYITPEVYSKLVSSLEGIELEPREAGYCGTVLDRPGPWILFPFEIRYEKEMYMDAPKNEPKDQMKKIFIAKVLPETELTDFKPPILARFKVDGLVTKNVLWKINDTLKELYCDLVNYPKLHLIEPNDVNPVMFVYDDFCYEGEFEVHNYQEPMSFNSAMRVMKALATLHAGSVMFKRKHKEILDSCPNLPILYFSEDPPEDPKLDHYMKEYTDSFLEINASLLDEEEKYKKHAIWVRELKKGFKKHILTEFSPNFTYRVLSLGMFGCNQFYFSERNDEVYFSDFGSARMSSPAVDISVFFYSCLDAATRQSKRDLLISIYYNTYEKIYRNSSDQVPFTLANLTNEISTKVVLGWYGAVVSLARNIGGKDFCGNRSSFNFGEINSYMDDLGSKIKELYHDENSTFKERYFEILEDLVIEL